MGIVTDVVRVAADINVAPYTQDITGDLGGLIPKAAVITVTYGVTDGVQADDFVLSYGAATGASNQWAMGSTDEDGQASTDAESSVSGTSCIRIHNPGSSTIDGEAAFVTGIANGITINWTNAPSAAYLITVELFGGSDLSAHANYIDLGNSVDNAINVTDPGFEPEIVITACRNLLSVGETNAEIDVGYGLVHNNGIVTQRSMAFFRPWGAASGECEGRLSESYGIMDIHSGGAVLDWGGEFDTFDADGFTVTTRIDGANNTDLLYLALSFGGVVSSWVGTVDTPTSTGNNSQTGPNFKPQFVHCLQNQMEAINTAYANSALAGPLGMSAFNDTNEYANYVTSEQGVPTTDTKSASDALAISIADDDGSAGLAATFVSMDTLGWTWNFSAIKANAKKMLMLVIEEFTEPTPTPDVVTVVIGVATHHQSKQLTILAQDPLFLESRTYSENITDRISGHSHETRAQGGYYSATLSINDTVGGINQWFAYGLGRHIEIYNPGLAMIWTGFVNKISLNQGGRKNSIGPLLNTANIIAIMFSVLVDISGDGAMGGQEITTPVGNAASIARNGSWQKLFSINGATTAQAEQLRDTYIVDPTIAYPPTSMDFNLSGSGAATATLDCLGYWHFLKAYHYLEVAGTDTLSGKIENILDNDINGIFSNDYSGIVANTSDEAAFASGKETALTVIKRLVSKGDAANNPYTAGIYNGQRMIYAPVPTEIGYQWRGNRGVTNSVDGLIDPWDVEPGKWIFDPEFLIGHHPPVTGATLGTDPRAGFIEVVKFSSPDGLSLNGVKLSQMDQILAKRGLGGM